MEEDFIPSSDPLFMHMWEINIENDKGWKILAEWDRLTWIEDLYTSKSKKIVEE